MLQVKTDMVSQYIYLYRELYKRYDRLIVTDVTGVTHIKYKF